MIERMISRHRNVRLLGLAGAVLLCGVAFAVSGQVPQVILPASVVFCLLIYFAPMLFTSRWTAGGMPLTASARQHGSPRDTLRRIDAEIAAGRDVRFFGTWRFWTPPDLIIFTPNWLVQINAAGVSAVRLDDVLWVFKRSRVMMQTWGRERVVHGLRVYYRPDYWEVFPLSSPDAVDDVLGELLRRRPEVLAGHFEEHLAAAVTGTIAAEVERRRNEWAEASPSRRDARRREQRRELNEATQHLALADRDPFDAAWRTTPGPAEPIAALSLRRIIAAEWRRLLGNLAAFPIFALFVAAYLYFWFVHGPQNLGPPGAGHVYPGGFMLVLLGIATVSCFRQVRRSFIWDLRRQLAGHGPLRDVVAR